MCLLHDWISVDDEHHEHCRGCFESYGHCPHSFKVCAKCGKPVGYGSHGKLTIIPGGCRAQIASMRPGRG